MSTNITSFITEGLELCTKFESYPTCDIGDEAFEKYHAALPKALLALQIAVKALDSLEGVEPYVTRVLVDALAEIERVLK